MAAKFKGRAKGLHMWPTYRGPIDMRLALTRKFHCDLIGHAKARVFSQPGTWGEGIIYFIKYSFMLRHRCLIRNLQLLSYLVL